jgi:hypothetical protein
MNAFFRGFHSQCEKPCHPIGVLAILCFLSLFYEAHLDNDDSYTGDDPIFSVSPQQGGETKVTTSGSWSTIELLCLGCYRTRSRGLPTSTNAVLGYEKGRLHYCVEDGSGSSERVSKG